MQRIYLFLLLLFVGGALRAADEAVPQSAPPALIPVTLQFMWKHQFEYAGFYAAVEQGFYRDAGLDVDLRELQSGMSVVDEVVSGRAQYGVRDASLILDRHRGAPVVLLANIFQHSPLVLLSRGGANIFSPAHMPGKRVMLSSHEADNASIVAMLRRENVVLEQLRVLEHSFDVEDFIAGNVDIISAYATNQPGVLKQRGIAYNIIDPINYGIDFYGNNLFTSAAELARHPEQARRFVAASLKGWAYALEHPAEIIDLILERYSHSKGRDALAYEARELRRFILPEFIELGHIDLQRMERIVETYRELGMISGEFPLNAFIPHDAVADPKPRPPLFTEAESRWIREHPRLSIGVDPDWAPFEFIDADGNYAGMAADYIRLLEQRTGLYLQVQHSATWKEVITSAREGRLDLLPAVMASPERREFLDFTRPHISYPMVIVTRTDAGFISGLDELEGRRVAVVEGYVTQDLLRRNHPGLELVPTKNLTAALEMVSTGGADAFVDNLASITHAITRLGISNLRISGTTPYEFALSIGVRKGEEMLLGILQKVLDSLTKAEIKAIRERWISLTYTQAIDYTTILKVVGGAALILLISAFWIWRLRREVAERKRAEQALAQQRKRLELVIQGTGVGVWDWHIPSGNSMYNERWAEMLGYRLAELEPLDIHTVRKLVHPEDMQVIETQWEQVFAGERPMLECEIRMQHKDGHWVWVSDTGRVVERDTDGRPVRMAGTRMDVTERKRNEELKAAALRKERHLNTELAAQTRRAEAAGEAKSRFLATMSHEIRTPLNGVLGMAEVLSETELDPEQRDGLDTILRSGQSLMSVINDVLDFSKLDAEQVVLEQLPFDLELLSHDCLEQIGPRAREKGLELILDYPPDCPRHVTGDPTRLRQVLGNLLGNALKFTERGFVQLLVRCVRQDAELAQLRLSVRDSGVGVDLARRDQLFDAFTQADQSTTRKYGGTGLGLGISKKLVELMGGSISVESILGEGATFAMDLPLCLAAAPQMMPGQVLQGIRILAVDDLLDNRVILQRMLGHMGADVVCLERPEDVQPRLREALQEGLPFHIAIVDHHMPGIDGLSLARGIRGQAQLSELRLMLWSSSGRPGDAARARQQGFDAYVGKPLLSRSLRLILQALLVHRPGDPIITRYSVEEATPSASQQVHFQGRILLVEDVLANRKVATSMLKRMGLEVIQAEDGLQALNHWQQGGIDLVFMDCRMPNMDGLDATLAIRAAERHGRVPIIGLTANSGPEDLELCRKAGMDHVVTKPFRKADLEQALSRWLASAQAPGQEPADTQIAAATPGDIDGTLDIEVLGRLRRDMQEDFPEVLEAIQLSMADILQQMDQAWGDTDGQELTRLAHSLKSPAANLGAMRLSALARDLERRAEQGALEDASQRIAELQVEHRRVARDLERVLGGLTASGHGNL